MGLNKAELEVLARAEISSGCLTGEESASEQQDFGGVHFLAAVWLRARAFCWRRPDAP